MRMLLIRKLLVQASQEEDCSPDLICRQQLLKFASIDFIHDGLERLHIAVLQITYQRPRSASALDHSI